MISRGSGEIPTTLEQALTRTPQGATNVADRSAKGISGTCTGACQSFLECTPEGLDWIQLGGVGRKEQQARPDALEQRANASVLVNGKIVQDNHVPRPKSWREVAVNELDEPIGVDCTVEGSKHHRAFETNGSEETDIFSSMKRTASHRSLPYRGPSVPRCHRDIASRFIKEDEVLRIDFGDLSEEFFASTHDIRSELLACAKGRPLDGQTGSLQ